jgi:hypothetical protein
MSCLSGAAPRSPASLCLAACPCTEAAQRSFAARWPCLLLAPAPLLGHPLRLAPPHPHVLPLPKTHLHRLACPPPPLPQRIEDPIGLLPPKLILGINKRGVHFFRPVPKEYLHSAELRDIMQFGSSSQVAACLLPHRRLCASRCGC